MKYIIVDTNVKDSDFVEVKNIITIKDEITAEKLRRRGINLIKVPEDVILNINEKFNTKTKEIIKEKPYSNWVFNEETKAWKSPKKITFEKTKDYYWDVENNDWIITDKNARPTKTTKTTTPKEEIKK